VGGPGSAAPVCVMDGAIGFELIALGLLHPAIRHLN